MKPLMQVWVALILIFSASAVDAAKVEQNWQLDAFEKQSDQFFTRSIQRLSQLPGFQCSFEQLVLFGDGGNQRYSGDVALLKPRRFRWSYAQPYAQLYVGDGESIWHYEADLMQAERLSSLEQVDPAVMKLLDGRVTVDQVEIMEQLYDQKLGVRRYHVRLQDSADVWLGFNQEGDLISIGRMDKLGNSNQMSLSSCSYVAPSTNLFSFTPPEGVDVLDLRTVNRQ